MVRSDAWFDYREWGVKGLSLLFGGGRGMACLPKEVEPRSILPLGPLHADPVGWHPGSSYAEVGGAHQSNRNPTIDVSTCLRLGLPPLGGQEMTILFRAAVASTPSSPSTNATKGEKYRRCWRQASRYIFFFPRSALWRHYSGSFFWCVGESVFTIRML